MADVDYMELQRRYAGRYIARRNGEVVASAETYDELSERLDEARLNWGELLLEYVEPATVVGVY